MGEPTCFMHPFSYTSGMSNESTTQGNPVHALGESISFGRFMSESLAWEKWSTFSHNRYVEEAERYAQPGSVAQKKAFFEAHYKKSAAKKTAALLEQQNADSNTTESEFEGGICNDTTMLNSQTMVLDTQLTFDEQEGDAYNSDVKMVETENGKIEGNDLVSENLALVENHTIYKQLENVESRKMGSGELTGTPPLIEKPFLKNSSNKQVVSSVASKKKPLLSSLKSSVCRKPSKVHSTPAKPIATIHARKENITPTPRKSEINSIDINWPTPKALGTLINFTPSREPVKSTNYPTCRTADSSRIALGASKAARDCATPRTPKMGSMNEVLNHPAATPCTEYRRVKTPVDPTAPGNKIAGPKWHIFSSVYSKSVNTCRKKLQSPNSSTPFTLRTEERAARRKQKLETKFNAKESQKALLQTTLKEKAETELKKLRRSIWFKARPLPKFYRERETPKKQIKQETQLTHPRSPKLGRKPNSSTLQGSTSLLHPTSLSKKFGSNSNLEKNVNTSPHIQH